MWTRQKVSPCPQPYLYTPVTEGKTLSLWTVQGDRSREGSSWDSRQQEAAEKMLWAKPPFLGETQANERGGKDPLDSKLEKTSPACLLALAWSWNLTVSNINLTWTKIDGTFKGSLTLCQQQVGFFSRRKFWSNFFGKLKERKNNNNKRFKNNS